MISSDISRIELMLAGIRQDNAEFKAQIIKDNADFKESVNARLDVFEGKINTRLDAFESKNNARLDAFENKILRYFTINSTSMLRTRTAYSIKFTTV